MPELKSFDTDGLRLSFEPKETGRDNENGICA